MVPAIVEAQLVERFRRQTDEEDTTNR
jgi:hypothetical protein